MANAKLGKFFEQPKVYLIIVLFAILLYVTNINQRAGITLGFLGLTGSVMYLFQKPKLLVNNIKGNTPKALLFAGLAIFITVALTILLGYFLGAFGIDLANLGSFLSFAKQASIGAAVSPFANNWIVNIIIFGILFPLAETLLALQVFDLILQSYGIPLNIKDWRVWTASALIGFGAIFYHIYAKTTTAGAPNPNVLMVMFFIFFVECLLATYTKEKESSIWHHIINNILALL